MRLRYAEREKKEYRDNKNKSPLKTEIYKTPQSLVKTPENLLCHYHILHDNRKQLLEA